MPSMLFILFSVVNNLSYNYSFWTAQNSKNAVADIFCYTVVIAPQHLRHVYLMYSQYMRCIHSIPLLLANIVQTIYPL
jgi:hypothetical protein